MEALDLLTLKEVYDIPEVMQTGNLPLPKPYLDLRKKAPKKGCPTDHLYWLRRDVKAWLESLKVIK